MYTCLSVCLYECKHSYAVTWVWQVEDNLGVVRVGGRISLLLPVTLQLTQRLLGLLLFLLLSYCRDTKIPEVHTVASVHIGSKDPNSGLYLCNKCFTHWAMSSVWP